MSDLDLTKLSDELLAKAQAEAERSLAMCEPLRWKSDEGLMLWQEVRARARELQAESMRRVSADLGG